MPTKLTPQSLIADIPGLSGPSKEALFEAGYSLLGQLHELDFADIAQHLLPPRPVGPEVSPPAEVLVTTGRKVSGAVLLAREQKALAKAQKALARKKKATVREQKTLFKATLKAGIAVRFKRDALVSTVPTMSPSAVAKLTTQGIAKLEDLGARYFPDIYVLIGIGAGKDLLRGMVLAGVAPRFDKPDWQPEQWRDFVEKAVADGLLTWEDVAVTVCGEMNPPQVGTAVANAVKHVYGPRETMKNVFQWLYDQDGRCAVSGKRIFLEADHITPKEQFIKEGRNVKEADTLDNFQLLTKRENVIKRGSHKLGGLSFAPAGAVMTYILLSRRPTTYAAFARLCREHGLTMADIRFVEGWAFAVWLAKAGMYKIDEDVQRFIAEATLNLGDDDAATDEPAPTAEAGDE